jgi:hypothetical protein
MDILSQAVNRTDRLLCRLGSGMFGFVVFATLLSSGCEDSKLGTVDTSGTPPYLRAATIRPDTVSLKTITPSGGKYTVTTTVQLNCTDPQGSQDILSAGVEVYFPYSSDLATQATLADDGKAPDSTAGDHIFTGTVKLTIAQTDAGPFRVRFHANDALGLESNSLERTLQIDRANQIPVLSDLVAPDSVKIPSPRDTLILMTVKVTDPDGPGDIREVYFRSLDSSDPNAKYFLLDNGNPNNGDAIDGDGVYSIIIILRDSTTRKTFRFSFQATDAAGESSVPIVHSLKVQ